MTSFATATQHLSEVTGTYAKALKKLSCVKVDLTVFMLDRPMKAENRRHELKFLFTAINNENEG